MISGLTGISGLSGIMGGSVDPFASIRPTIVSQYKMNGLSGAGEPDTVGGYNLLNNGTVGTAAGKVNTCRVFNTSNWLSIADGTPFNLYPMTVSCWMKHTATGGMQAQHYSGLNGWSLYSTAGKISFFIYIGGGNKIDTTFTTAINTDAWTHVAITLGASGATCYINGSADGATVPWTGTPQAPTFTGPLSLGADITGTQGYVGNLDVFKIANTEWSPAQVLVDNNSGLGVEL